MAGRKQPYRWGDVRAGDIISFRYKSKSTGKTLSQTILVLNPRLNVVLKKGGTTMHLIGIKIEESNRVSLRMSTREIQLLEQIGDFKKIDDKNDLYKLEIKKTLVVNDIKGIKPSAYEKISKSLGIQGQYRTYDYMIAKKSAVYLEPIKVVRSED